MPSAEALAAYRAARTPQAVITLADAPAARPTLAGTSAAAAAPPAPAPATAAGGVFPAVNLALLAAPSPPAKGAPLATSAPATVPPAGPPPVSVTLQFDPARAGGLVWVQTLDGGDLSAVDADGSTVYAQDGFAMEIHVDGTVVFTYQAPAIGGHYQVLTRLEDVSTVLPFDVPAPAPAPAQ